MKSTAPLEKRFGLKAVGKFAAAAAAALILLPMTAQTPAAEEKKSAPDSSVLYEIFSTKIPDGTQLSGPDRIIRDGGYARKSSNYLYVDSSHPAELSGLSIPIRENPGPGEYRYITFTWVKWGGTQIGLQFEVEDASGDQRGRKFDYTYIAGSPEPDSKIPALKGLRIGDKAPGWIVNTRDLWKDFGDFTLTGVKFLCPERRDSGFDEIFLAKTEDAFIFAPRVLPSEVATPLPLDDNGKEMTLDDITETEENAQPKGVQIDWAAQIRAGGFMMYPLYLLGILALVIGIQRLMTSRTERLAPLGLRRDVNQCLASGDIAGAIAACGKYPSTLANSLRYIFEHRSAGREVVSQTAGDIAARDIRAHLSRIYPISIISSLSPLVGLLGTVVGMIEAFGLVALYGDEGGAAILSDSISKALITTAAGLIIAVPAIALYFFIKNHVMNLASTVEVEIENVITKLYLDEDPEKKD